MTKPAAKPTAKDKNWAKAAEPATTAPAVPAELKAIVPSPIAALIRSEIWAREAGVKFNTWEAVPQEKTPIENVLKREFWANVSARMGAGDTIIVLPRDGSFYLELVVWDAGQNWADVEPKFPPMQRPALAGAPGVDAEFDISHDPIDGVCVKRRSTGAKLKTGFANREDARTWIIDHQKALRA